jgi:hypothetical protein
MRRIRNVFVFVICITVVAGAAEKETYNSCLDYIKRNGKLWGVCEVATNDNGTVTIVDAKHAGFGYGLTMYDSDNKFVSKVMLSVKQQCRLSDGHHAFLKYEVKAIKDGVVEVTVTDRFDARSFGKDVTEKTETVSVKPYKDEDKKPEPPAGGDGKPAPQP